MRRLLFACSGILLLGSLLCPAENKRMEAEALLQRAQALSDIRSAGSPGFRLAVDLTLHAENGSTHRGTYTEIWVSKDQWRRETTIGGSHRIEVGNDRTRWTLDDGERWSLGRTSLGDLFGFPDALWIKRAVDKIKDRDLDGRIGRCVVTKPFNSEYCFEKATGLLLAGSGFPGWNVPEDFAGSVRPDWRQYSDHQQFLGKQVPRTITDYRGGKLRLEAKIVRIDTEINPDPSLFVPPPGAKELANCPGPDRMTPPHVTYSPDPEVPRGRRPGAPVALTVVVGADGVPHDPKVFRSMGPKFDDAAILAAQQWRFKPAQCDGQPVPVVVNIEIVFAR